MTQRLSHPLGALAELSSLEETEGGMAISLTTRKRLWANAGRTCAFPACDQRLLIPMESEDGEVVVGRECHIVARSDDGPRAPASLTPEDVGRWASLIDNRDGYANLVLLCGTHHNLIDNDVVAFPVERVVQIKLDHERTVDETISPATRHEENIEVRYAGIIDAWSRRIDIDAWDGRISGVVVNAAMREDVLEESTQLRDWLLRRVWPRTIPQIEDALLNFRMVEQDLDAVVTRYSTRRGGLVLIDRVYQEVDGPRAGRENIEFLERRSDYFQDLAADLAIELTRAVNLVCDRVREHLWPNYRLDEGYATVGLGLTAGLVFETLRPVYPVDAPARPYPGLSRFVEERADRDYARGGGPPPVGASLPGASPFDDEGE